MLSRVASAAAWSIARGSSRVVLAPTSAVPLLKRSVATGDNSQILPFTDAGMKEFNYDPNMFFHPPAPTILVEKVVQSVEDCKFKEPLDEQMLVKFGPNMPTIHNEKNPQRDVVNFPREKPRDYPEAVRWFIIPDNWFRAFYDKTGVTGPYCLVTGLTTFLLSKEWLIIEHEMLVGFSLATIWWAVNSKFGKDIHRFLEGAIDYEPWMWDQYQKNSITTLNKFIECEKESQESLKGQGLLFEAKRENVHLQREAEYRKRLMAAYSEVKRKLDYQIASQVARQQFNQKHMVSWIIDSVMKGITPQQEKETLQKCILDLKALATSRAGVI